MEKLQSTQRQQRSEEKWTEQEQKLAEKFKVEPKLVRLLKEVTREQQEPVDPLEPQQNSVVIEDWFSTVHWSGQMAAVLLFHLLTSKSERHREIGRHILRNLSRAVEDTEGLTSETDMFVRELLFEIAAKKMNGGEQQQQSDEIVGELQDELGPKLLKQWFDGRSFTEKLTAIALWQYSNKHDRAADDFFFNWEKEITEAASNPEKIHEVYSGFNEVDQIELMAVTSLVAAWIPISV